MWGKKIQRRFDAAVWTGHIDVTTTVVRISMLLGLGALWFAIAGLF